MRREAGRWSKARLKQSRAISQAVCECLERRTLLSTYIVTTANDDNGSVAPTSTGTAGVFDVVTLRDGITAVNTAGGTNTITFLPATFSTAQSIYLANGNLELSKAAGNTDISGPGAALLTVSGNDVSQVFIVDAGVSATLSGMDINEGFIQGSAGSIKAANSGGGIFNAGTVALQASTVGYCYATYGGGIANLGLMTITGSKIEENFGGSFGGICNSGTLTLTDSTVVENDTSGASVGGIQNSGTLTLVSSTVTGNEGGGVGGVLSTGKLTLNSSTVSRNYGYGSQAGHGTGGIGVKAGTASFTNSTISGNGGYGFGGVYNSGTTTITDCTISGNASTNLGIGAGIYEYNAGSITLDGSIVAGNVGNSAADDLDGARITGNHNLIEADHTGSFTNGDAGSDLVGVNPDLAPLGNFGGLTWTMALLPNSPAINAGATFSAAGGLDERGVTRPQGSAPDIGAFESVASSTLTYVVTTAGDDNGTLAPTSTGTAGTFDAVTLRDAVNAADLAFGSDVTITFSNSAFSTPQVITLANGPLLLSGHTEIIGTGNTLLSITGDGADGVLSSEASSVVTVQGVTFTNLTVLSTPGSVLAGAVDNAGTLTLNQCNLTGTTYSGFGSYFFDDLFNAGRLVMNNCSVSGNDNGPGATDAIDNAAGTATLINTTVSNNSGNNTILNNGTLTLINSTVSGNQSNGDGGGILNEGALGVYYSTISGNSSATGGGGVYVDAGDTALFVNSTIANNQSSATGGGIQSDGTLTLFDSTISGNTATDAGGGIYNLGGVASLYGVIAYGNTGNSHADDLNDSGGTFAGNHNLIGADKTGTFTNHDAGSDLVGVNPQLHSLANNGGATDTMALPSNSPAVDAGATFTVNSSPITVDQRGVTRPQGAAADIGAFEYSATASTSTSLAASGASFAYGQNVTLTATVTSSGGSPTGTVTFFDGATTLGTANVSSTKAVLVIEALSVGPQNLTATFGAGNGFAASTSPAITVVFTTATTTTTLSAATTTVEYGQNISFTATVTASNTSPTGTVTFLEGSTTLGTAAVNSNKAVLTVEALTLGQQNVTASYGAQTDFAASTSSALSVTVTTANTTTTLASSANPAVFGQTVTFTATVVSTTTGSPTGTVTFKNGSTTLGTGTISGGMATFATSTLAVGGNSITAVYGGATDFATSTSSALTQTITAEPTTTTISSSVNPQTFGQSVTFTATVVATTGNPTGSVSFVDGATTLGSVAVNSGSGQATFATAALPVGTDNIIAVYGGATDFAAGNSSPLGETVNAIATTVSLSSALNPAQIGQAVTFTATVTATSGSPTGTVTFLDGSTTLGTASVNTNTQAATFATAALTAGTHTITAAYGGAADYAAGTSTAVSEVINLDVTTTTLSTSLNPAITGQFVTFTATVASTIASPSGTVTFLDGDDVIGSGAINPGNHMATFSTNSLAIGTHSVTAMYGGASTFAGSTSAAISEVVNPMPTTATLATSLNPAVFGQSITYTATITAAGGTPSGSVTFLDGTTTLGTTAINTANHQATFSDSALAGGSHSITAVYAGATGFAGSTSSVLKQTINPAATTTTLVSSTNSFTFGQPVTFTATVTSTTASPMGTVTFDDGSVALGAADVSDGQAIFVTQAVPGGANSVTAVFNANTDFSGSTSSSVSETVAREASSTALASSQSPAPYGTAVTFTATVTAGFGSPSGTVTFKDGITVIGTASINTLTNQASYSASTLAVAVHNITAAYGGANNWLTSTSTSLPQTIVPESTTTVLSALPRPGTAGQAVQLTATVTAAFGTPTGIVTFLDGATTLGTATISTNNHEAVISAAALAVATHTLTAVYGGATDYATSTSAPLSEIVNLAATTTMLKASQNPATIGQTVVFTADVTSLSGNPVGTVTFLDGSTVLGAVAISSSSHMATYSTNTLAIGGHSITASYAATGIFAADTSSALTENIVPPPTTTTLSSSANPGAFGQAVTLTATVTAKSGTPSGTVTFLDGATTLGTAAVNTSTHHATFSDSGLAVGAHSITAVYGGVTDFATSTSSVLNETIKPAATTTTLARSGNPSVFGQPVAFTATVTSTTASPAGTVIFTDGSSTLGMVVLNDGQAAFNTSTLPAGNDSITAAFAANTDFAASNSSSLNETITPEPTTTTFSSSVNPATFGEAVTFTAMVTATAGTPGGKVSFVDGTNTLGTATINTGTQEATFATTVLAVGTNTITAVYGAATDFMGSKSAPATETVTAAPTVTVLSSTANPAVFEQGIVVTATVTATGGSPTGLVTFLNGATTLATAAVNTSTHKATFNQTETTVGIETISAVYAGGTDYLSSTATPLSETVNPEPTTTTLASSLNPATYGQGVTFTAHVTASSGSPTGNVTFLDGTTTLGVEAINTSNHEAIFAQAESVIAVHAITAVYGGATDFAAGQSAILNETVHGLPTSTSLSSALNPATFGQGVTFTAHVTSTGGLPTGTVAFVSGSTTLGTATVNSGTGLATFATAALPVGSNSIVAVYGGGGIFAVSQSSNLNETIKVESTTTTLISSENPSNFGDNVTFTATVTAAIGAPGGTVTFKSGSTTLGTAAVNTSTNQAVISISTLAAGTHTITAAYGGASGYAASTSPNLTQTVHAVAPAAATNGGISGEVDFTDLAAALGYFSRPGTGGDQRSSNTPMAVDGITTTNFNDLAEVLKNFLAA